MDLKTFFHQNLHNYLLFVSFRICMCHIAVHPPVYYILLSFCLHALSITLLRILECLIQIQDLFNSFKNDEVFSKQI